MRYGPRTPRLVARSLALGCAVLLTLSGCAGGSTNGSDTTPAGETTVGATPEGATPEGETTVEAMPAGSPSEVVVDEPAAAPEDPASDSGPADAMVTPRPGMVDVEPVTVWYEYGNWDGELLYVTFRSQGEPCEVLDRIEIDETGTTVAVTLYQGRDPGIDPAAPCDGPWRTLGVVLPPLQGEAGPEGVTLVNGAN